MACVKPLGTANYDVVLNSLYRELLSDATLTQKIKSIVDVVTETLGADFSRIWITRPGDLCERGCLHGSVTDGPHVCRERNSCLHLIASSGRYTHTNGRHRRVPFGAYKIGRVASGEWSHFVTNDVVHDERVHDHEWAKRLGLVSFAGYRLVSSDGRTVGVLAMFSKKVIAASQENLLESFAAMASQAIMVGVAQETLRESEEKYRTLVDNMQDAVYRCDLGGRLLFCTPSAARLLGYSSVEELVGKDIAEAFYSDPQEREKLLAILHQHGVVTNYEVTLKRKDGTSVLISTNSHFYRDRDGEVIGIEGVYRDVTKRKLAEEALRQSEEKYRTLVENANDGIVIVQDGIIKYANPRMAELDGSTVDLLIGSPITDHIHPSDVERVADLHRRRMAGEEVVSSYEALLRRRDGTPARAELTLGVFNYKGRSATLAIVRDTSDRRRLEEELRKSRDELELRVEERTQQLRESEEIARNQLAEIEAYYKFAPVGLAILDRQLRHVRVNQKLAEINGISPHEHIGRTVGEVVNQKVAGWLESVAPRILEGGETIKDVEITRNTAEGQGLGVTARVNLFPVRGLNGSVTGIGLIYEDITENKRLEDQLRQAHKMEALGIFAGGIAHDFNNILAAIIGFCELARDKTPEMSPTHRHLERVLSAGLRGRDLVRQILTFSRQTGLEQKVLQLGSLVKETVKLLRASIPATIHMQVNAKGSSHFVLADPTQMQQVLMNLCANAAHAMGESGGTLTIDLGTVNFSSPKDAPDPALNPGRYVRLSVSDTGAGMTADVAGRIFDPFFTTKKPAEGTGLGLPVAHGIVAKHGGAITVWSEPGRGSIFTVYLPEYRGEGERSSRDRDTLIPHGHERVLIVEDEEPLAQMMDEMLTRLGYAVTCRTGSREALALIRHDPHQFDLVITDQTMPGMTGIELAKEVHATRPNLPVILCTGFSSQTDVPSVQRAGISTSITKPLTRAELAKTVREVLDR
ncbi:MAG TPA: hypothetical protein DCR97_13450 [Deltaproteobacteria bacterium]|nr:hypothetical protein [Deltaproteobacteria bacterium]